MCLTVLNTTKEKIASEDIICYKFFRINLDGSFTTPYRNFPMEIGKTYKKRGSKFKRYHYGWQVTESKEEYLKNRKKKKTIFGGGFHSFKDLKDVKKAIADDAYHGKVVRCKSDKPTDILAQCTIPKGSVYIEGEAEIGYCTRNQYGAFLKYRPSQQYCSKTLRIDKILKYYH